MCGITGIYYFDKEKKVEEQLLIKMRDTVSHTGPDDSGFFIENNIGLRHSLIIENNNLKEICYWELPEIDENNLIKNKKKVYEKFEEIFEDALKIRTRSEVPFGVIKYNI